MVRGWYNAGDTHTPDGQTQEEGPRTCVTLVPLCSHGLVSPCLLSAPPPRLPCSTCLLGPSPLFFYHGICLYIASCLRLISSCHSSI